MDQAGAILLLILYFVFKTIVKTAKKNPAASGKKTPRSFPPRDFGEAAQNKKRAQAKHASPSKAVPTSETSVADFHGEDSIRHDHWQESKIAQKFELPLDAAQVKEEKNFHVAAADRARSDMGEPAPAIDLFSDLSGHGLVKAIVMQEILGKPKALR